MLGLAKRLSQPDKNGQQQLRGCNKQQLPEIDHEQQMLVHRAHRSVFFNLKTILVNLDGVAA